MLFAGKCTALMHLYGQVVETTEPGKVTHNDVNAIERTLIACAKRRNEYAHAYWIGLREEAYVRVKSQSKKRGLFFKYRKFDVARMEGDVAFSFASHTARKTFGYLARIEGRASVEVLMKAYNHASAATTLIYLCVQDSELAALYSTGL